MSKVSAIAGSLHQFDPSGSGAVSPEDFSRALKQHDVHLTPNEMARLVAMCGKTNDNKVLLVGVVMNVQVTCNLQQCTIPSGGAGSVCHKPDEAAEELCLHCATQGETQVK